MRILEAAGKRAKGRDPEPERPEPQKQKLPDRMRESAKRALTKGQKLTKIIDPIAHLSDLFYRAPVGFSLKIHRSQRVAKFLDKVIQEFSWINPKSIGSWILSIQSWILSIQESESHPPPGTNACEIKIRSNFCMFIMLGYRAKFARLDNEAKAHPTRDTFAMNPLSCVSARLNFAPKSTFCSKRKQNLLFSHRHTLLGFFPPCPTYTVSRARPSRALGLL